MATAKKSKISALDVKALAAELGATVKKGKVVAVRDRYYFAFGEKKYEIPVGRVVTAADIRGLVGRDVAAVVAGKAVVAVGGQHIPRCYWILCYVPAPDVLNQIRDGVRGQILTASVKAGIITAAQAARLGEVKNAPVLLG